MSTDLMPLEERLEAALHGLGQAMEVAGEARAKAEALDERRKQIKAVMIVKFRGEGKGMAEAEAHALASETYKLAAGEWEIANYDYRAAEAKAKTRELAFEAWRTANANERARINLR